MIVVVASRGGGMQTLRDALAERLPGDEVLLWPHPRAAEAEVLVGWDVPPGIYAGMARLRLVHSIAAGTDNVQRPGLARQVPVCRVADPSQARGMLEYVRWGVTYFHRAFDLMARNQRERQWLRPTQMPASRIRVGVMGLGSMGLAVARGLHEAGYETRGWSRSPRAGETFQTFAGRGDLPRFLDGCQVLVCLLPLTGETRGILNRALLEQLAPHAALVHCGRGEHLVEDDLRTVLDSGHLRGALIDVFEREPLDAAHWLWSHPRVLVTPHVASEADPAAVISQIAANIDRVRAGQAPHNAIDRQ